MAKKRSQKTKRALAARARAREEHARMMIARQGDPNFAQQTRTATGRTLTLTPDASDDLRSTLGVQRAAFIEQFGREPGPEDPVFFDATADTPAFRREEDVIAEIGLVAEAHREELGPEGMAIMAVLQELGYLVTSENAHTFTAHEVETFSDALTRARIAEGLA